MTANLIIPRVEVFWGAINLTHYKLQGCDEPQPLVYNVSVSLSETGSNPTGSMTWQPSGAAFDVLAKLIGDPKQLSSTITIRFYYLGGRSITFHFLWAGVEESYGTEMGVEIRLISELDGLTNSNVNNTAQSSEEGIDMVTSVGALEDFYGIKDLKIVEYSPKAESDMKRVKILSQYQIQSTFLESVASVTAQNGNILVASNYSDKSKQAPKLTAFAPFTGDEAEVQLLPYKSQNPDNKIRYGYILGPGIVDTLQKVLVWKPNQVSKTPSLESLMKFEPDPATGVAITPATGTATTTTPAPPQQGANTAAERSKTKPGASGSHTNTKNMRVKDNAEGELKKIQLEVERNATMSSTVFVCPSLMGIKPCDIVYLPSYNGKFVEDWIVSSVSYKQTDGGVEVSLNCARQYGLASLMNPKAGKAWVERIKGWKLVGEGASLEAWEDYAWKLPLAQSTQT
jgi:hypothetical protein